VKFNPALTIGVFIVILGIAIAFAYKVNLDSQHLKVFQPDELNPELVDSTLQRIGKMHRVGNFNLVNQEGKAITPNNYDSKIYVVSFFFTTCQNLCPKLNTQMSRVNDAIVNLPDVKILSHTVYPEIDTIEALATYANDYGAKAGKWDLVTGPKPHLYELARRHYFAAKSDGDGGPNDFIHTENFVLVDKEKRIRGYYDGTKSEEIDRLIYEIDILIREYDK